MVVVASGGEQQASVEKNSPVRRLWELVVEASHKHQLRLQRCANDGVGNLDEVMSCR